MIVKCNCNSCQYNKEFLCTKEEIILIATWDGQLCIHAPVTEDSFSEQDIKEAFKND